MGLYPHPHQNDGYQLAGVYQLHPFVSTWEMNCVIALDAAYQEVNIIMSVLVIFVYVVSKMQILVDVLVNIIINHILTSQ